MAKIAFLPLLFLVAAASAAGAQSKLPARSARSAAGSHAAAGTHKLPPGIPVVHGIVKTAFSLKYEDYKIGTGPLAEPNKLYHVLYTGYIAATGQIFDSSEEHRAPLMKDGKPVMGPDGKPEMAPPQPLVFAQGYRRLIPGFDEGFAGMHVGGKRRIFTPWQLGYGTHAMPARGAEHPGIPAKSDLIFDVELVDVTDLPPMPARPMGMPPHPPMPPAHPGAPGVPTAPVQPATPPSPATPPPPK